MKKGRAKVVSSDLRFLADIVVQSMDLPLEECLESILSFVSHANVVLQDDPQSRISRLARSLKLC